MNEVSLCALQIKFVEKRQLCNALKCTPYCPLLLVHGSQSGWLPDTELLCSLLLWEWALQFLEIILTQTANRIPMGPQSLEEQIMAIAELTKRSFFFTFFITIHCELYCDLKKKKEIIQSWHSGRLTGKSKKAEISRCQNHRLQWGVLLVTYYCSLSVSHHILYFLLYSSYVETRMNGHAWYVTSDRIHFSRRLTGPRWRKESYPQHLNQNR